MTSIIGAPIHLGQLIYGVQNTPMILRKNGISQYISNDEGDICTYENEEDIYKSKDCLKILLIK